jgi:hypothetical protein
VKRMLFHLSFQVQDIGLNLLMADQHSAQASKRTVYTGSVCPKKHFKQIGVNQGKNSFSTATSETTPRSSNRQLSSGVSEGKLSSSKPGCRFSALHFFVK